MPKVEDKVQPKVDSKDTSVNTNRSGLGDDTNPGKGAGTSNAVNDGTINPSKAKAYALDPVLISQINTAA